MSADLATITAVTVLPPSTLDVTWEDGSTDRVNLAGWIATGGEILAPLADETTFRTAAVGDFGGSIEWGGDDDLAIDSHHLSLLAAEQRPFAAADLAAWQAETKVSNQEAAEFLGIALSTWNAYKAGAEIPKAVRIACRAATRDPVVFSAHLRPRKTGRPRKTA